MLLELNASKAERLIAPLLKRPHGGASIRAKLTAFAESEGLPL
jgi:phosphotransferase system enzyme I (PtsP)